MRLFLYFSLFLSFLRELFHWPRLTYLGAETQWSWLYGREKAEEDFLLAFLVEAVSGFFLVFCSLQDVRKLGSVGNWKELWMEVHPSGGLWTVLLMAFVVRTKKKKPHLSPALLSVSLLGIQFMDEVCSFLFSPPFPLPNLTDEPLLWVTDWGRTIYHIFFQFQSILTTSNYLKITQNVAFDFLNFVIFHRFLIVFDRNFGSVR